MCEFIDFLFLFFRGAALFVATPEQLALDLSNQIIVRGLCEYRANLLECEALPKFFLLCEKPCKGVK
jgi:hypothetical protein